MGFWLEDVRFSFLSLVSLNIFIRQRRLSLMHANTIHALYDVMLLYLTKTPMCVRIILLDTVFGRKMFCLITGLPTDREKVCVFVKTAVWMCLKEKKGMQRFHGLAAVISSYFVVGPWSSSPCSSSPLPSPVSHLPIGNKI